MLQALAAYIASLVVMLLLDLVWLGVIAKKMYADALGPLLADAPKLVPAIAFYLLYPVGVVIFAISPALAAGSWTQALVRGALFGFFGYMTYEFTNLALIRDWPASLVAGDIAWGVVLTAAVSVGGYYAGKAVS
jgi:uncharacterized membrane protein